MSAVNNNLLLTADAAAASSYQVSRSCRFNAPDSAYFNRTPSVAGNQKTYTLSLWEKRSALNAGDALFSTVSGSAFCYFSHGTGAGNDTINFAYYNGASDVFALVTTAVYRDPASWYHIVLAVDTTQATASNRVKIYVNGVQVTQFSSAAYPALNYDTPINSTISHILGGATSPYTSYLLSAYLADVHFIDGQALTPSSFTETNATTGQLVPKAYGGSYGVNGFRLNFSDNSAATAATLGADSGGGISSATGALPIYNTTDNYGIIKGIGTRTDSNASSLVLAIPMDGANNGTTFTDESANIRGSGTAKAITRFGDTKTLTAQSKFYGSSGFFDGTGDYLTCDSNADFNIGTGDYTFETWVYKTSSNRLMLLAIAGAGLSIAINTSGNIEVCRSLTAIDFTFAANIQNNTWTHVAVTRFGTSLRAFKDGALLATQSSSTSYGQGICYIGIDANASTTPFVGYIQDFRIYKGVAKYTSNFTPTFGPNNWTPNNLSVSNSFLNGNNGTLVNGPTFNSANGGSIVFDGVNDYVGTTALNLNELTISAWVKFSSVSNTAYPTIINKETANTNRNFWIGLAPQFTFGRSVSGSDQGVVSSITPNLNQWYYVVATNTLTPVFRIYINGVLNNTATFSGSLSTGGSATWIATYRDLIYPMNGNIAQVSIYNRALSAEEVTQNYNALVGRFGGTSTGSIVTDGMVLNLDAGNSASYPGTGTTWTDISVQKTNPGNDSLTDTPTSYGTDTGVGGEVRGNYATLNPLDKNSSITLSNGNLDGSNATAAWFSVRSTIGITSGKFYWEYSNLYTGNFSWSFPGLTTGSATLSTYVGGTTGSYGYAYTGDKYTNATGSAYGATWGVGDVIGVSFDADAGNLVFYKNGVSQGVAFSGLTSGPYFPALGSYATTSTVNFAQRPFAYAAPSGFKALCDTNLPAPTIAKGSSVFDTTLYTGNSSARSLTGIGFQPDLVWIKSRSQATGHGLFNSVVGATKVLSSNTNGAQATDVNSLTSFNSDGFSLGTDVSNNFVNVNTQTYVAWNWKASVSNTTNTAGSITSTVRANTTSGFSVVSFNAGSAGNKTVGHGLGVPLNLWIVKSCSVTGNSWSVGSSSLANQASVYLSLNLTHAAVSDTRIWANTAPTSTVFSFESNYTLPANSDCIAYCFAAVTGYSSFGSYTGNGSADGPFVYTGFRPRWILTKPASATGTWNVYDTARATANGVGPYLFANSSDVENATGAVDNLLDINANGFKLRFAYTSTNTAGGTYIYAAFAENPFQYARAR